MQPATSAFGVIAVLYVMITATVAENSSGAIEPGINHPGSEERRASGNETARARSNLRGSLVREDDPLDGLLDPRGIVAERGSNGTAWNIGVSTITSRTKEAEEEDEEEEKDEEDKKDTSSGVGRASNTSIDVVDGLQGDQSDVRAIPGTQDDPSSDPRGPGTGHVLGSAGVGTPPPPDDRLRLVLQEDGTTPRDLAVATTLLSRLLLASERVAAGEDLVADQASGTRSDGEVFNNEARRQQARPLGEDDRDDPRGTDSPRMENLVEDRGQEFSTTVGSLATGFVTTGTVRTMTLARGSGGTTTSPWTTTASSALRESIAIDAESRSLGRKDLEDLRAISFQVPPVERNEESEETEIRGHQQQQWWQTKSREYEERKVPQQHHHHHQHQQQEPREQMEKSISVKIDEARKLAETRKDHSRPVNNLLLAGSGKSTKAFYEIKPSIKTEMEKSHDPRFASGTTTQRILTGRKFILPSVDSAFGKFGPYFEDGDQEMNITARIGSTVLLNCKIGMLGDKKVTWLQHSKDSFRLLTVGRTPYSVDQRISLNFRYPSNWRLQILYASPRDSGLYKCQVATHPPLVKKINVIVTAPILTITDDSGRIVAKERHLKAGSALRLRCEARDVLESQNESVVWTRGDETLTEDVSENRTTEISAGKEVLVIVSTLIVERASPRHAGNYSCVVPGKAKTTLAVHVLNGELPAAVHDGNGVSRAVLNLWLIHLTVSYVFSR